MTSGGSVATVDLGATSGRVIVGHVNSERVQLRNVVEGMQAAAAAAPDLRAVGLWLLSESLRTWELHDGGRSTPSEQSANLQALLAESLRSLVCRAFPPTEYAPAPDRRLAPHAHRR